MSKRKTGFLEDHHGNPSSMRLMSITSLVASIIFGVLSVLHPGARGETNGLYITMAFLVAAFAPKALQKFAEARFPTSAAGAGGHDVER
ncbi:hypothetical protein [Candidatus Palauibacter sp.]|uniref:hypothetical protein n=1 Tax=Candidatus Palauibacter sp. TaxID=3101350 RepID=UPI003B0113AA